MDWYLDARDPQAVAELRHEFRSYIERHAAPGSDVAGAELAFAEVLGNVTRHAPGHAWVSVDWTDSAPILTVHDLGPGFKLHDIDTPDPLGESGRGLFMVGHLVPQLEVAGKRAGGTRVRAVLPVSRPHEQSHDPQPGERPALPAPEEADDGGAFGKESFLRALTVQLAQAIEMRHGPDAAAGSVAQVGADVGKRMEEAYRQARAITGRLDTEQIADLFVRLKTAIDGDFYVVEASEEKIVLGNRRCPFGEAVMKSPALCRMTSSVFGGIAARNRGAATVQLEERIAVGDPECRVVVWLGDHDRPHGHRYRYVRGPAEG